MEIRTSSKIGPLAPSFADATTSLSRQTGSTKQRWLDRPAKDPAGIAQVEVEIHDHFRGLADQMTAGLLSEATSSGARAEPEKKGGAATTDRDAPRRRDG
jgi:hypothetical protein